jgi:hypothetical protein
MKVKIHLDTDDYLIIGLLLIGTFIAAIGIYSIGSNFVEWLSSNLSNVTVR